MKKLCIILSVVFSTLNAADMQQELRNINALVDTSYANIVQMLTATSSTINTTVASIDNLETTALQPLHTMLSTELLPLLQNLLLIKAGLTLAGIGDVTDVLQDINELVEFIIQTLDGDIKPPLMNIQKVLDPNTSSLYGSLKATKSSINELLQ